MCNTTVKLGVIKRIQSMAACTCALEVQRVMALFSLLDRRNVNYALKMGYKNWKYFHP